MITRVIRQVTWTNMSTVTRAPQQSPEVAMRRCGLRDGPRRHFSSKTTTTDVPGKLEHSDERSQHRPGGRRNAAPSVSHRPRHELSPRHRIDYCAQCRGVWLDRGELDKILERSAELQQLLIQSAPLAQPPASAQCGPRLAGAPAPGSYAPGHSGSKEYSWGHGGSGGGHAGYELHLSAIARPAGTEAATTQVAQEKLPHLLVVLDHHDIPSLAIQG
ncbi:TFIIB-type zinc ribbon-containing protein [Muricoccus vinaceus]|uniref:Zf-TFIIB domain-containing protein n=1 Tax=Muricoccus vinaceus TaxID=424704 RepID=A0ABV6IVT2_9PROT